jgi:hypothetical protein
LPAIPLTPLKRAKAELVHIQALYMYGLGIKEIKAKK